MMNDNDLTEEQLRDALAALAEMKDAGGEELPNPVPIIDVTTPGIVLERFGSSVTVVDDHGVFVHFNEQP